MKEIAVHIIVKQIQKLSQTLKKSIEDSQTCQSKVAEKKDLFN
jgi:hypothetical protein